MFKASDMKLWMADGDHVASIV